MAARHKNIVLGVSLLSNVFLFVLTTYLLLGNKTGSPKLPEIQLKNTFEKSPPKTTVAHQESGSSGRPKLTPVKSNVTPQKRQQGSQLTLFDELKGRLSVGNKGLRKAAVELKKKKKDPPIIVALNNLSLKFLMGAAFFKPDTTVCQYAALFKKADKYYFELENLKDGTCTEMAFLDADSSPIKELIEDRQKFIDEFYINDIKKSNVPRNKKTYKVQHEANTSDNDINNDIKLVIDYINGNDFNDKSVFKTLITSLSHKPLKIIIEKKKEPKSQQDPATKWPTVQDSVAVPLAAPVVEPLAAPVPVVKSLAAPNVEPLADAEVKSSDSEHDPPKDVDIPVVKDPEVESLAAPVVNSSDSEHGPLQVDAHQEEFSEEQILQKQNE